MRPAHLPSPDLIRSWPPFSDDGPLPVLVSACLAGDLCGVDGASNGVYPLAQHLLHLPNVRVVKLCPEHEAFGTPRKTPDITGGDGFDVLDSAAKVVSDSGDDWTEGLVRAAGTMRDAAIRNSVRFAPLMDVSAACGSSVIYDGPRHLKVYRRGPGVATASLMRAGIPIVSQRDEGTLALMLGKLGALRADLFTDGLDHYPRSWYRDYFSSPTPS